MIEPISVNGSSASNGASRVLVTGATGFVAGHIIEQLLAKNYIVRGTVRSVKDQSKLEYLYPKAGEAGKLELVEADLLKAESFVTAVQGVDYVMHTASPYVLTPKDAQKDLVDPAVNGTLAVLNACLGSPSVKKVIITSSVAAVTDEPIDGHVYTEADWNTSSSLARNPYYFSKTQAERAAWAFVETRKPHFKVVVINPFVVIGPQRGPNTNMNESNKIFADMLNGKLPGILSLSWGLVDVRDVAVAHILAMEKPEAEGRYLTCAGTRTMKEVGALYRERYPNAKVPTTDLACCVGDTLVKLGSYFQEKGVGDYLRTNIGHTVIVDNSKVKALGVQFRPIEKSLCDLASWLSEVGHVSIPIAQADERTPIVRQSK